MKEYILQSKRNPEEVITIISNGLTPGQMKEIWRDGYTIIAIR